MRGTSGKRNLSDENYDEDDGIQSTLNEDGTVSSYFDKRKLRIAPRSTLQFKVGPPFNLKSTFGKVVDTSTGKPVKFEITPRIDRGFDNIDDEWVGYKRNYFTLVTSFQVCDFSLEKFLGSSFQLHLVDNFHSQAVDIKYFAVMIKARMDDEITEINLVQHTAKRDKGPQFAPVMCPLVPSELPKHQTIREASNVRNTAKMKKYDSTFYFHRDQEVEKYGPNALLRTYPKNCIQKVARYERVQFASSINMKKPGQQSRHFSLYVILGAVVDGKVTGLNFFKSRNREHTIINNGEQGVFISLQEMNTPPLIIRGRSPSNYNTSQREITRTLSSVSNSVAARNEGPPVTTFPEDKKASSIKKLKNAATTLPKRKCGRPPKNSQKDEDQKSITDKENISTIEQIIKCQQQKETTVQRIQTIEHIENIFSKNVSPTGAGVILKTFDRGENAVPLREYQVFKDHQTLTRKHSVNIKEIELKNLNIPVLREKVVIGPMSLSQEINFGIRTGSISEENQYDIRDNSHRDENTDNSGSVCTNWKVLRPTSSSSFNIDRISCENISYIEGLSENIQHFDTHKHENYRNDYDSLLISSSRHIEGTQISRTTDHEKSLEVPKTGIWRSFEVIHSDSSGVSLIHEELSFL